MATEPRSDGPQWLVRTAQNALSGPFNADRVREMINAGELGLQDELCAGNGYWFQLHEHQEVRKYLGIDVPKRVRSSSAEEETDTGTETLTDTVEAARSANRISELRSFDAESGDAGSTMASKRGSGAASQPSARPASGSSASSRPAGAQPARVDVSVRGVESPSVWRGVAWVVVTLVAILVFAILRVLRSGPV